MVRYVCSAHQLLLDVNFVLIYHIVVDVCVPIILMVWTVSSVAKDVFLAVMPLLAINVIFPMGLMGHHVCPVVL